MKKQSLSFLRTGRYGEKNEPNKRRYLALLLAFLLILSVYFGNLVFLHLPSVSTEIYSPPKEGNTTNRQSAPSLRGDIYDCNGKLLVTSEISRSMVITYSEIPETSEDFNRSLLRVSRALKACGKDLREDLFPIYGTYPELGYYAEATDGVSVYDRGLQKVLSELGLSSDADCETLVRRMVSRYHLKLSGLSNEEITEVLRLRYHLLLDEFGIYRDFVLAEGVDDRLFTYIEELNIPGVAFCETVTRKYLYPGYASHILGQVGKIPDGEMELYLQKGYAMDAVVGISGCEAAFEDYLHGIDGVLLLEKDKDGNLLRREYEILPIAGQDVYLTIDIDVQIAAEDALRENIREIAQGDGKEADAGSTVAIDPNDFSVKAIASYPTYDLSTYHLTYDDLLADETLPLLNRALSGTYEPGSTFKVGVALAALETETITKTKTIDDIGIYTYYAGYQPRCWIYVEDGHGHGPIAVQKAITVSCNYFFYEVGRLLGIERIASYMKMLGLGEPTGIEIAEQVGNLASPENRDLNGGSAWTPGDTLQAAIGQSDNLFTPLQIATYFAAIFNGGTRYSAHLFSFARDFGAEEKSAEYENKSLGTLSFSDETYRVLLHSIIDVIDENAALSRDFRTLRDAGVTVGGKTGTAQVSGTDGDNALFAAYAYSGDQALISVTVIEHGVSGSNAAFTAAKVMECYFLS